jgi:integrase
MDTDTAGHVESVIAAWRPRRHGVAAAGFARQVVLAARPATASHARSLLWCCAALCGFGELVGLEPDEEVLLSPSFIERFITDAMAGRSPTRLRSVRTNLRFVGRRVVPKAWPPDRLALPRNRSKAPYTSAEITAYLRLADAQPTELRRNRLSALICLGAGAGLSGPDMRSVRGSDVECRSGGVVVTTRGRVVPLLTAFHPRLTDAARYCGERFLIGGVEETRKNLTSNLLHKVAGGTDLPRIELGRLRATWLLTQAAAFSLAALFSAGGFSHSQYLGDIVAMLSPPCEDELVRLLGGRHAGD